MYIFNKMWGILYKLKFVSEWELSIWGKPSFGSGQRQAENNRLQNYVKLTNRVIFKLFS